MGAIHDFHEERQKCCIACRNDSYAGCLSPWPCFNSKYFSPRDPQPEQGEPHVCTNNTTPFGERNYVKGSKRLVSVFVEHYVWVPAGLSDKEVAQEIQMELKLEDNTGFSWVYEKDFRDQDKGDN